jgi:hypothetical protein
MFRTRSLFLAAPLFCAVLLLSAAFVTAGAQTAPPPDAKLALRTALVITPEFCATKITKGSWATIRETFEVGKIACAELEPALQNAFTSLNVVAKIPETGDIQIVLIPRFVDVGATIPMTAFSNREMDVFLEWTAKDMSGKTVWIETVQGTSRHHVGNLFTHNKNLKLIVRDSVKDAAQQSASTMSSSPELRKLIH